MPVRRCAVCGAWFARARRAVSLFQLPQHHGAAFYAAAVFQRVAVTVTGTAHSFDGRFFCPRCGASVFAETGDEIELHLGVMDAPNQFTPTYELWTCRREAWLPPVGDMTQYDKD